MSCYLVLMSKRYAVKINATNRNHDPITRYLCRGKHGLCAPHIDLDTLIAGGNLATYATANQAHAVYVRFLLNNPSIGCTASFEIFSI